MGTVSSRVKFKMQNIFTTESGRVKPISLSFLYHLKVRRHEAELKVQKFGLGYFRLDIRFLGSGSTR